MPSDPGMLSGALGTGPVANAVRWWLDELRALGVELADGVRAATLSVLTVELNERGGWSLGRETGGRRAGLGTIDVERLDDEAVRRTVRRLLGHARPARVALLLPDGAVLTRVIRLPAAATADLGSILEFELARHTPFTAERACYRHRVLGRTGTAGMLEVELEVAPRELIDGALGRLAAAGLAVDSVTAARTPARDRRRASLLPSALRAGAAWTTRNRVLAAVAGATLLVALLSPIAVAHLRLVALERDIRALQPTVDRMLGERAQRTRLDAARDAVVAAKRALPSVIEIVAALTHALPDGSWLSSLQLAGRELIIDGYAPAAAALARPLETVGPFAQVGYRAPITRDPQSGLEQFQFELRLAERRP